MISVSVFDKRRIGSKVNLVKFVMKRRAGKWVVFDRSLLLPLDVFISLGPTLFTFRVRTSLRGATVLTVMFSLLNSPILTLRCHCRPISPFSSCLFQKL